MRQSLFFDNTDRTRIGEIMNAEFLALQGASKIHDLEGLLKRRLGNRIRELRLIFQQSGLILRGRTETYYAKQIAQHVAMEHAGVPILANEIEVN
jgi:hypothetical protein